MNDSALERHVMSQVGRRLLPFLFVLYIFCYLDRSNISIAALQMNDELRFGPAVFGLGAGVFFAGYALFEIPSNLILARVGARLWIARIMVSWGVLAVAMMWVKTPAQFYAVRFLLGLAEAGFFPGVIYYLSQWFPPAFQARAIARFSVAIPLAQVLGGVVGGPLLGLHGAGNLSGWQWLFLLEGLPSVILGVLVLFYLPDGPRSARWLSPSERDWLVARLAGDPSSGGSTDRGQILRGLRDPLMWLLTLPYFAYYAAAFAYTTWAPQLVRTALGTENTLTTLVTAAIALIAVAGYLVAGAYSDRSPDRRRYAIAGLILVTAGCIIAAIAPTPLIELAGLILIPIGSGVFLPTFWCLPRVRFSGRASAAPIAMISAIGSTGGFLGPYLIGYAKHATGDDRGAFALLAAIGLVGCGVCIALRYSESFRPNLLVTQAHTTAI